MVALIIPIYNRAKYVSQCFESLSKLTTQPDVIILIDDCSTDLNIHRLCQQMRGAVYIRHSKNMGVREALKTGANEAIKRGADIIINLDSDAIVLPNFISILLNLKTEWPDRIISGFNSPKRILSQGEGYYMKRYLNGINMLFTKQEYSSRILPALDHPGEDWDWNLLPEPAHIVSKPSCVQHIGMESSMGHSGPGIIPDVAEDFPTSPTR